MVTVFLVAISYLWNDFLYVYFYKRVFMEKYSSKVTFWATIFLWLIQIITKIIPFFVFGLNMTVLLSFFMVVLHGVHLYGLFEGSVLKRAVAFVIALIVQGCMDLLGLNLTSMIVGNYELLQIGSEFTLVASVASCSTITVGMLLLTKAWQIIENINWRMTKREWPCAILPVSQIFLLWHVSVKYSITYRAIPVVNMCGCILGFIADIYVDFIY